MKAGVIEDHFPLHDKYRHHIFKSWKQKRMKLFFGMLTGNYIQHM